MKLTPWLTSKVISLLIFLLCGTGNIFAQGASPSQTTHVLRYKTGSTTPTYQYTTSSYSIGRANGSNGQNSKSDEDIIRSAYSFSLSSIPKDATINSVKLTISISGYQNGYGDNKAKVVSLAQSVTVGAADQILFDAIGSGTTYFDDLVYSSTYSTPKTSTDFTNAVKSAVSNPAWSVFNIGVLSKSEGTNGTYANVTVNLEILYTPKVSITVQNSFGTGYIKIDGAPVAHNSTVPMDQGSTHALLAYAQTINNVTYSPDGTWTKVSTGEQITQNPLSITPMSNETYRANYTSAVNMTIKNSFDGGFIRVNNTPITSGTGLPLAVNSTNTLEAYNQDFQAAGESNYFRLFRQWDISNQSSTTTNPLSITADAPRTYTAVFKKQYNLSAPAAIYIESGSGGSYTVNGANVGAVWQSTAVEGGQSAITLGALPPTGWTFVKWSDNLATNPRTFIPTDHTTLSATYKYLQHTQSSTALANTSQRKIIRTLMGTIYKVYESMNHVWLERSTDEGTTWTLCNNGPIDTGLEAKSPSIEFLNSFDYDTDPEEIYITYQQKLDGGNYSIELAQYGGYGVRQRLYTSPSSYSSNDAMPVLSMNWYWPVYNEPLRKQIVGIWKEPANTGVAAGLYWYAGYYEYENSTFNWNSVTHYERINNTDASSTNPTIDVYKYDYTARTIAYNFHLAYEQNGQQIYYRKISCGYSGLSLLSTTKTPSYGDGFNYNTRPSIAAFGNDQARMCWHGVYDDGADYFSQAVFADPSYDNHYWDFGMNVSSTSINGNYDDVYMSGNYAIAWTENSSGSYASYAVKNSTLSNPSPLTNAGKDLQLYNGWSWDTQKGLSLSTSSPYALQVSSVVDPNGGMQKSVQNEMFSGRMGVITSGTAQFHFTLGNITVDGKNIDFVPLTDTAKIKTSDDYKSYLVSKPFELSENSQFLYDVQYGVIDSAAAVAALSNGNTVEFKVELVDASTNEVIGTYDDVKFKSGQMARYTNIGYDVETKGIGSKTVKLRLLVSASLTAKFSLADKRAKSRIALGKTADERVKKNVNGIALVTEYALAQNYPNPFNPSTTISYAIPEAGVVTVKVFDILGKEVATLVNEYKSEGRYNIAFDASHLSSGIYIYRIQAGKYSATRKMQLLK